MKNNVFQLQTEKDKLMFEYWKLQKDVRIAEESKIKAYQDYYKKNNKFNGLLSKSSIIKNKILDIMKELEGK